MEGLRIYFRKHQLYDTENSNQPVVVSCGNIASYVPGTVDQTWHEMTQWTEGLEKLQMSWDAVNVNAGSNEAGSNYDKGISSNLTFSCDAFQFIWDYLLDDPCGILNSIDVRIVDTLCEKELRLFEIKCDNLVYRPEDRGMITVTLREQDLKWHCVHKTMIWDDWNGFMTTKNHPTFLTCVEPRPRLLASARMGLALFYWSNPGVDIVANGISDNAREIMDANNFVPAPLIRDYIDNVAGKCGITVDTIFHRAGTPEYQACIFHPVSGGKYESNAGAVRSPSMKMIEDNRWNVTLAELLDALQVVYASEWYITADNKLIFSPLIEAKDQIPILDFTSGDLLSSDLEYSFSGDKKPAYGRYQYAIDGADLASQEIAPLYNDIVDYDGPANNPMLEGEKTKIMQFAPTAFVRDGKAKDYMRLLINDGNTVASVILVLILALIATSASLVTLAFIAGFIGWWKGNMAADRNRLIRNFVNSPVYTGSVRMAMGGQTSMPRILIWDGIDMDRAKAIKEVQLPQPVPYYNKALKAYTVEHDIAIDNAARNIFNYPAYFDSKFSNNLYDRFHDDVDNPLKSLSTNQEFSIKTELCCDTATVLGLWGDSRPAIGYLVKLEEREKYGVYGRITRIVMNYEDYTIELRGVVIKQSS